jgi:hypothetical protein
VVGVVVAGVVVEIGGKSGGMLSGGGASVDRRQGEGLHLGDFAKSSFPDSTAPAGHISTLLNESLAPICHDLVMITKVCRRHAW